MVYQAGVSLIGQILLDALAIGGAPANWRRNRVSTSAPCSLTLGRHLGNSHGRIAQFSYLLAEGSLIAHGPHQVEGAARRTDQHLSAPLYLNMAVWLHLHASLLPWILSHCTRTVTCCNKVRIYLSTFHATPDDQAFVLAPDSPWRAQIPKQYGSAAPPIMFCCS